MKQIFHKLSIGFHNLFTNVSDRDEVAVERLPYREGINCVIKQESICLYLFYYLMASFRLYSFVRVACWNFVRFY